MPRPLLIYPGEVGPFAEVNEFLAERHEEAQQARRREIEERKAAGTPLDGLEELSPFVADARLAGIHIACIALSERQRRRFELQESACLQRLVKAQAMDDPTAQATALADATDALFDVRRAFLTESLNSIEIDGQGSYTLEQFPALFDALERSRLFTSVYLAAVYAQEMPPGKALRSGQQPASTSTASTADAVQSIAGPREAVMVAHAVLMDALGISRESDTPPTPAHGGT